MLLSGNVTDAKGKERKCCLHEEMMTPDEKLKSLPEAKQYLKSGVTFEQPDAIASSMSDNEAADALNKARQRLFKAIPAALKKCA